MPQKTMNEQGYIFVLPSLGLPEQEGDWTLLKVAFGTKAKANQLIAGLEDANAADLPRRFMSDRNSMTNVDYEGAMWMLPLVTPQKAASEGEVFTVKARRLLSMLMPKDYRPRLPKGVGKFEYMRSSKKPGEAPAAKLATAKSSIPATEADEDAFWTEFLSVLEDDDDDSSSSSPSSTPSPDDKGYLFHLPSLGQPSPKGEWVTLRAASGTKQQAAALLANGKPTEAPLKDPKGEDKIVDVEFQGAVWLLPHTNLKVNETKPELFSIKVFRKPAASVPGRRERASLPSYAHAAFVNKSRCEWSLFDKTRPKVESASIRAPKAGELPDDFALRIPTPSSSSPDDYLALDGLEVFRVCLNPTTKQSKPLKPPKGEAEAAEWKKQKVADEDYAYKLWQRRGPECVSMDWIKEAHIEAARAGLRKFHWDPREGELQLANMRQSPEEDGDVRGMDYALNGEEARKTGKEMQWRPLPSHAADEEWVRCGVNIVRRAMGKKLFTKESWATRQPTSLMLKYNKKTQETEQAHKQGASSASSP